MLTVLWYRHGFHIVTILLQEASFNAGPFIDRNLVTSVADSFHGGGIMANES
jgi:hypothetical protein